MRVKVHATQPFETIQTHKNAVQVGIVNIPTIGDPSDTQKWGCGGRSNEKETKLKTSSCFNHLTTKNSPLHRAMLSPSPITCAQLFPSLSPGLGLAFVTSFSGLRFYFNVHLTSHFHHQMSWSLSSSSVFIVASSSIMQHPP